MSIVIDLSRRCPSWERLLVGDSVPVREPVRRASVWVRFDRWFARVTRDPWCAARHVI